MVTSENLATLTRGKSIVQFQVEAHVKQWTSNGDAHVTSGNVKENVVEVRPKVTGLWLFVSLYVFASPANIFIYLLQRLESSRQKSYDVNLSSLEGRKRNNWKKRSSKRRKHFLWRWQTIYKFVLGEKVQLFQEGRQSSSRRDGLMERDPQGCGRR